MVSHLPSQPYREVAGLQLDGCPLNRQGQQIRTSKSTGRKAIAYVGLTPTPSHHRGPRPRSWFCHNGKAGVYHPGFIKHLHRAEQSLWYPLGGPPPLGRLRTSPWSSRAPRRRPGTVLAQLAQAAPVYLPLLSQRGLGLHGRFGLMSLPRGSHVLDQRGHSPVAGIAHGSSSRFQICAARFPVAKKPGLLRIPGRPLGEQGRGHGDGPLCIHSAPRECHRRRRYQHWQDLYGDGAGHARLPARHVHGLLHHRLTGPRVNEARDQRRLLNLQRQLSRLNLLIIDELGIVPLFRTGA